MSEVAQSCPTLTTPWTVAHQAPLSMGFSRQGYWSGLPFPSPGHLPDPGIEPRSPTLRVNSLPAEPQGKAKNTGVGSLSLLFPTEESNRGLLHCRQILYQVSHKGRPRILEWVAYPVSADLPNPGIEPGSPVLQADSLPTEHIVDPCYLLILNKR